MQQLWLLIRYSLEMMQLLTLLFMALEDGRSGSISRRQVKIFWVLCVLEGICVSDHGWIGLSAGIPGILLWICGYLWKDSVGMGDILILLSLGFTWNPQKVWGLAVTAIILSGGVGWWLQLFHGWNGKERMPWVPYMGAATLGRILMEGIEEVSQWRLLF